MATNAADLTVAQTATEIISTPDSPVVDTGEVIDGAVETQMEDGTATETQVATPAIPEGYISEAEHQRRLEQSRRDAAQAREDKLLNELQPLIQEARTRAPQPVDPATAAAAEYANELQPLIDEGEISPAVAQMMVREKYRAVKELETIKGQANTYNQHMQQQYASVLDKAYTDTLAAEGIAPNTPELQMVQEMTKQRFAMLRPEALTPENVKMFASEFASVAKQKVAALRGTKPAGNPTIEPGAAAATVPQSDYNPNETLAQMFERKKREALAAEGIG